jgi:hypothetical protein
MDLRPHLLTTDKGKVSCHPPLPAVVRAVPGCTPVVHCKCTAAGLSHQGGLFTLVTEIMLRKGGRVSSLHSYSSSVV